MNTQQAEKIVTEYVKKIYGFALKKTVNLQDAEDLAQDITLKLYSSLLIKDVDNINAFVWCIAHNTLVNYYRGKAKRSVGIPFSELEDMLSGSDDPVENFVEAEMIKQLQNEIAYLSKIQRRIIILYYYEGKKQGEIAEILSIPVGTVKWHLFNAKQKMKKGMETMRNVSELKFNPIKFNIMGFIGSVGTMGGTSNFFRSTLSQNIAYCAYHEAKTIHEIAENLGVSPVYIESEVDFLEEYGFLIKKDGKYLTNMIIDEPDDAHEIFKLQEEIYSKAAKLISNELFDELMKSDLLKSDKLYYPDNDKNFLAWGLLLYLLAWSNENAKTKIRFDEVATIRKDGGINIALAGLESTNGSNQKYFDSMKKWFGPMWNGIENDEENILLWQINSEWSDRDVSIDDYSKDIARDLKLLNRFITGKALSIDEYTFMLQKGYIKKKDDKFELAIIWLKDEAIKKQFLELCDKIKKKHKNKLEPMIERYCKAIIESKPKHIQKMQAHGLQYILHSDGWFLLYTVKELLECGKLQIPANAQRLSLSTLLMPNN
ncbi:MAG: hypothetical protein K0S41_770 [Anaerocolumna sp.]|nr:hypothetical protein [Anaerocolumna sp.]